MTRSEPKRSRLTALLAVVLLATGACSPTPTTAPSAAAPATGAPPSAPASQGGTLSIAYQGDIQSLDPAIGYDTESWAMIKLLYNTLVTFDKNAKIVPSLAEAMPDVSADGLKLTFKLRKGVQFVKTDGSALRELTADDVVYSLNRVLNPNLKPTPSPIASSFFGNIVGAMDVIGGKAQAASGIKAIDPYTVEIDLATPDRTILDVLADPFGSIVPKEFAKEDSSAFSESPVGSGPFYLKSYTKGQQAVFARNTHYWESGMPLLDEIVVRVGVDANSQLQQVQAGTLDITGDPIPSGSFTSVVNDPQYKDRIVKQTLNSILYIWMDTQSPDTPLKDVKVRQAIEWAIDKENILKIVHNQGVIANCILPPGMPGYDPTCTPYGYNPAKAKQMLADAGYPNGFSVPFYTDTTDPNPQIAQAIQQDLAQIGVEINIILQEWATFNTTIVTPHKAPMGYISWYQDYPDPSNFIDPTLSCAAAAVGGVNYAQYCNKDVDAKSAAARSKSDPAKWTQMYQDLQKQIMNDAPWVPIWHQDWYTLLSTRVDQFWLHPVWYYDLGNYSVKSGS